MARYYLTLQLSAAAALPSIEPGEIAFPAPVVRQIPGLMLGRWDEREIVRGRGAEWIITRAQPRPMSESSMNWN